MTAAATRPRDVVLAGVLTIIGSVLALTGIFSAVGQLRSSQVRRELESLVAGDELAFDVPVATLLNVLEVALMAASAASVAAIVLAVYVMRRHNPSRIALTVLGAVATVFVLFSGVAGVAIAVFVAYTVSLLWRAPVRTWFSGTSGGGAGTGVGGGVSSDAGSREDERTRMGLPWWGGPGKGGRPGRPAGGSGDDAGAAPPPDGRPTGDASADRPTGDASADRPGPDRPGPYPRPWPPDRHDPQGSGRQDPQGPGEQEPHGSPAPGPGAPPGYGEAPSTPPAYPHGYGYPPGHYGYPPPPADPDRRPAQTVAAHVLTWVGSGLGIMTGAFFVLAASSPQMVDLVLEQLPPELAVGRAEFVQSLRVGGALTALWSAAVVVVSFFSWRRARWGQILLTVMGGAYCVAQMVSLVLMGQVAVVLTLSWVTAVIVLLWWPPSRQWYAEGGRPGGDRSGGPRPPGSPPRRNQPW